MKLQGHDYLQELFDGVSDLADRDLRENVAQLWFVAVGAIDALAKTGALDLEESTNWLQGFGAVTGQPELIPDAARQGAAAVPAITPRSTPVRRAVAVLRELSSVQIVAVESSSSWVPRRWQPLAGQTHARDVSLDVLVDDGTALQRLQTLNVSRPTGRSDRDLRVHAS